VLSVAGGHSSFGGPLNTYSLHAIATMVERLRGDASTALVHANGGYLTYQHAVLLADRPHERGYVGEPTPVQVRHPDAPPLLDAAGIDDVEITVETATVEHDRDGAPKQAFVVGRTAAGDRVAAPTADGDPASASALSLANVPPGDRSHVGRSVRLVRSGDSAVIVPDLGSSAE
jgi:acetyl-CoA C-acetyltransferase